MPAHMSQKQQKSKLSSHGITLIFIPAYSPQLKSKKKSIWKSIRKKNLFNICQI